MVQKSGNRETLSILEFDLGFRFTRGQSWDGVAGNLHDIGVVQGADFRVDFQANGPVRIDVGRKLQLYAVGTELDCDRGKTAIGSLDYRVGKLAARQELRCLPVDRG